MAAPQLLLSTEPTTGSTENSYSLLVAKAGAPEVQAAQRLRHKVFAGEMGAWLPEDEFDRDSFDEHCDHIVVRDDHSGRIVGTYRMLPPDAARAAGGLYTDTEFDLSALDALRPDIVETGRSCVDAEHRAGAVVGLVWSGIARYMLLTGHRYLIGCASVPLADGGLLASAVWSAVQAKHYAPEEYRVRPHHPWDLAAAPEPQRRPLPPLLRGYLRLGAWVCGPPAHDEDFGVADFPVLLPMDRVDQRYLRYFLGEAA